MFATAHTQKNGRKTKKKTPIGHYTIQEIVCVYAFIGLLDPNWTGIEREEWQ